MHRDQAGTVSPTYLPVECRKSVFRSGVCRDRTVWGQVWGQTGDFVLKVNEYSQLQL